MNLAQQLTDVKGLIFPVVKLKIRGKIKELKATKTMIQIGDNYIVRQGTSILDSFNLKNKNQLETTAVYLTLQEFILDNYSHTKKELIIDSNFRLYSLNFCIEGALFTSTIQKSSNGYHLFSRAPYYLEEVIPNSNNKGFGIIAVISNLYLHIGWASSEIQKRIRI